MSYLPVLFFSNKLKWHASSSLYFQDIFTSTHVFQKLYEYLEYPKEMHWIGKGLLVLKHNFTAKT